MRAKQWVERAGVETANLLVVVLDIALYKTDRDTWLAAGDCPYTTPNRYAEKTASPLLNDRRKKLNPKQLRQLKEAAGFR